MLTTEIINNENFPIYGIHLCDVHVQLEDILKLRHILRSTTMDAALKKVALEQAAIILQGTAQVVLYMLSMHVHHCTTLHVHVY